MKNKRILYLTDLCYRAKGRNYSEEDIYITNKLKESFDVVLCHPKCSDSFEILPKNDNYPMTYKELTDVAKEEQNQNARPEIKDTLQNFEQYDTIYLGYPIWWGDLPMICYTFLESYDFSGKTIIPFCTHAGSGNAGTQSKIQSAAPNATVKDVLAIKGTDTQNDPDSVKTAVTDWLKK